MIDRVKLRRQLSSEEGVRRTVYDDATGHTLHAGMTLAGQPTIGIGRNLLAPLSDAAITFLFNEDVNSVMADLDRALPWWTDLDEVRGRVLVDMTFQLGLGRLLGFQRFLTFLRAKQYDQAAAAMLESLWAHQAHSRAVILAQMVRTGLDRS